MKWLLGCGTLFALALTLFVVPATLEGPVLVPISQGHGLSLVDVVALVPLLAGTALLADGLWRRRQALDAALTRRPWLGRAAAFVAGLGLGLLVASVYTFFWWWAIGATLLSATLLAAAVVAARSERPRARARSGHP
jgi:heme exporter protein D